MTSIKNCCHVLETKIQGFYRVIDILNALNSDYRMSESWEPRTGEGATESVDPSSMKITLETHTGKKIIHIRIPLRSPTKINERGCTAAPATNIGPENQAMRPGRLAPVEAPHVPESADRTVGAVEDVVAARIADTLNDRNRKRRADANATVPPPPAAEQRSAGIPRLPRAAAAASSSSNNNNDNADPRLVRHLLDAPTPPRVTRPNKKDASEKFRSYRDMGLLTPERFKRIHPLTGTKGRAETVASHCAYLDKSNSGRYRNGPVNKLGSLTTAFRIYYIYKELHRVCASQGGLRKDQVDDVIRRECERVTPQRVGFDFASC